MNPFFFAIIFGVATFFLYMNFNTDLAIYGSAIIFIVTWFVFWLINDDKPNTLVAKGNGI